MKLSASTARKSISFLADAIVSFSIFSVILAISGCVSKPASGVHVSKVVHEELNGCTTTQETVESFTKGRVRPKKAVIEEHAVYEKMRCVDKKGKVLKAKNSEQCRQLGGKVITESLIEDAEIVK